MVQKFSQSEKQEYIYRIKILLLGDIRIDILLSFEGVGKSSMIFTYMYQQPPKVDIKLLTEQIDFSIKKQKYYRKIKDNNKDKKDTKDNMEKQKEKERSHLSENSNKSGNSNLVSDKSQSSSNLDMSKIYECRMHIWDVSGELSTRESSQNFMREKMFKDVNAIIMVFNDEESLKSIQYNIWRNVEALLLQNVECYLVENKAFREKSLTIQNVERATEFAKQAKLHYISLDTFNLTEVNAFFDRIKKNTMQKILNNVISTEKCLLRDRQNNIVLRQHEDRMTQFHQKRYNRCC